MVAENRREPYVKMRIEKVHLVMEEAVLGGCKTSTLDSGAHPNGQLTCASRGCLNTTTS